MPLTDSFKHQLAVSRLFVKYTKSWKMSRVSTKVIVNGVNGWTNHYRLCDIVIRLYQNINHIGLLTSKGCLTFWLEYTSSVYILALRLRSLGCWAQWHRLKPVSEEVGSPAPFLQLLP